MTSGGRRVASSNASSPLPAVVTSYPARCSVRATSLRLKGKSSTSSTARRLASGGAPSRVDPSPTSKPVGHTSCSRMPPVTQSLATPIVLVEDDANDVYFVRRAFEQAHIVNPLLRFATARE